MKHQAALKIYEETKDLTFKQQVEYWRQKSQEAAIRHAERIKAAKSKHAA
jgi:hypothetical protein